jgi:hypothetical protein
MVPRDVYETFPAEERRLWHSHEYEVKSGMLILPKPAAIEDSEWEKAELAAMKEIINLYGKTRRFGKSMLVMSSLWVCCLHST